MHLEYLLKLQLVRINDIGHLVYNNFRFRRKVQGRDLQVRTTCARSFGGTCKIVVFGVNDNMLFRRILLLPPPQDSMSVK